MRPDFERLRKALLREGEPDRVPLWEIGIDATHKARLLGRAVRGYPDEFAFWAAAGYDHVPISAGFRYLIRPTDPLHPGRRSQRDMVSQRDIDAGKLATAKRAQYALDGNLAQRDWAPLGGDGLITSMAEFRDFPWPRVADFPYEPFEIAARELPEGLRVSVHLGWNFTGAWWLAGMERFLAGLFDQPELVAALVHRIGELQHDCLLHLLREHRAVIGVVAVLDDLAHLGGLLVSPDFLRTHVFPWYRETCLACHRAEVPVVLHSDGDLTEVMPDILACGFNALHPIEPQAMDIRALKREHGDRLCLLGNIDLAYPLGLGGPDDVRAAVKSLIEDCAEGGGLGVGSGNTVPEYVPYQNWTALREAALEFGRYPISA